MLRAPAPRRGRGRGPEQTGCCLRCGGEVPRHRGRPLTGVREDGSAPGFTFGLTKIRGGGGGDGGWEGVEQLQSGPWKRLGAVTGGWKCGRGRCWGVGVPLGQTQGWGLAGGRGGRRVHSDRSFSNRLHDGCRLSKAHVSRLPPPRPLCPGPWSLVFPRVRPQGCMRREGNSEAVRQAVGGGCQCGWWRFMSVTNAIKAGICRQGDSG